MFSADRQLMHGPCCHLLKRPSILSSDLVQIFENDLLSGSQVIAHTNTKKVKTDAAKINTFRKTKLSGGNNLV